MNKEIQKAIFDVIRDCLSCKFKNVSLRDEWLNERGIVNKSQIRRVFHRRRKLVKKMEASKNHNDLIYEMNNALGHLLRKGVIEQRIVNWGGMNFTCYKLVKIDYDSGK